MFKGKLGKTKSGGGLYRTLVSTETSLALLGVFAFLFFVGTVFPQSSEADRLERYREAGGKLVWLVDTLGLLDLFHSWYFMLLAALFMVHLVLCSVHRLNILRRRPIFRLFGRDDLLQRDHSFSIACGAEAEMSWIEKTLKGAGFRAIRYYSEDARAKRVVAERGLPYRWLSWSYHLCILIALIGFCLSYLLAFEGYLTIPTGGRKSLEPASQTTRWRALAALAGAAPRPQPRLIEIELERFLTEYTQKPDLQYPAEASQRLLAAWGLGVAPIQYQITRDSLYPRDWFSTLRVYEKGMPVKEKKIEVNNPLRYGGITFYQIGYEYEFDLRVGEDVLHNLVAENPFTIPEMEGEFRLRTPRVGTVVRRDGAIEILLPTAKLQHRPPTRARKRTWNTIAELPMGTSVTVMHTPMLLSNLRESSVLSYRFDPGVPVLWVAATLLMTLMAVRIYLPWYQVRCFAEDSGGRATVTLGLRMVGLFARPERVKQKLLHAFREERRGDPKVAPAE